jgi:hypothetical protein
MMVTSNQSMTSKTVLSRRTDCAFVLSDSTGPEFLDVGDAFADSIPSADPLNMTLRFSVLVRDPDGIDTVIGSYKNRSESIWKNVTMDIYSDRGNNTYRYFTEPLNFTLDIEHTLAVWDLKFYANDTLGNWNYSELGSTSYNMFAIEYQPDYSIVIVGAMGIVIIVAGVVYMKRRSV